MGWYADTDNEADHFKWQPVLGETETGVVIASLPTWFATEEECVDFIDNTIIPNAGVRED